MEIIREAVDVVKNPGTGEMLGEVGSFAGGALGGVAIANAAFEQPVESLAGIEAVEAVGIILATGSVGLAVFATAAALVRRMRANPAAQTHAS